jgi:hypothetical protein
MVDYRWGGFNNYEMICESYLDLIWSDEFYWVRLLIIEMYFCD